MHCKGVNLYAETSLSIAVIILMLIVSLSLPSNAQTLPGPLVVSTVNPRYFADPNGNIVFLAGVHTWSNGMEDRGTIATPPAFPFTSYVAFMYAHGFNWMRMWTSEMSHVSSSDDGFENIISPPYKWARSAICCANDGGNKFDFTRLDQQYFDRMRSHIIEAARSGIYVSVQLFNGYMWRFDVMSADGSPFERVNNVNSIKCSGTCPSDASALPSQAWTYEQAYLDRVVDTVHDLPNAMYEVSNEAGSPYSDIWQANIISHVNTYERTHYGTHHPIGFTFQYAGGSESTLYNSAADWVSPSAKLPGNATGQCPVRTGNGGPPNPSSPNCKVVINDTDHSYSWVNMRSDGPKENVNWVWKNFTHGNGVGFMDPYLVLWPPRNNCTGAPVGGDPHVCSALDPQWDPIRSAIADIRRYAGKINLRDVTPQDSLSTTAYCLADVGRQYLVFSPHGSSSFTLTTVSGTYAFEWFNTATHTVDSTGLVTVKTSHSFTPPSGDNHALWLRRFVRKTHSSSKRLDRMPLVSGLATV